MRIKTISAGGYDASTQVLTLQGKTPSGGDISVKIELDDVAQFAEIFASLALKSGATPAAKVLLRKERREERERFMRGEMTP